MANHPLFASLKGGLIVSCQPDADDAAHDPMNHPMIMAALAQAAVLGGAAGIRADTPAHIHAIRELVGVPIIGIYKADLPGFAVRITPTLDHARQIAQAGADLIAVDGTHRPRPEGGSAGEYIRRLVAALDVPLAADISTFEEGLAAEAAGAAAVMTTLSGYTPYSPQGADPDYALVERLARALSVPLIAEGRYTTPEQAARALACGAWAVTVGSAITRPRSITQGFARALRPASAGR